MFSILQKYEYFVGIMNDPIGILISLNMKVEVWSDIMCPFCYIGKKNYEKALRQFAGADEVEIEWKSFQLDPTIPQGESYPNQAQYLAERKGMPAAQVESML